MPTLVSKDSLSSANITGSNNFLSIITTTNALQTAGTTTAVATTTFATHTAFTGAGETVTAIGLELSAITTPPLTGITITLRVRNTTDGVNTDYVYNATDLSVGGRGWYFFSLGAGQVFTSGKSWQVQVASSTTATRVSFYRTATAGDWNRIFVTNTDATFATGDSLYLGGRILTSGSPTTTSMLVDTTISLANLTINDYSSLAWTSNGITMTLSGSFNIFCGGSFTVGTALSPVSGLIEFSNSSFGLNAFSAYGPCTLNIYGADVSTDYYIDLASTANAGQANAVLASAPDWVGGQLVAYSSTRANVSAPVGCEVRTISSVSSTTVTSTANFTYAHDVRTLGTYTTINDIAIACLMNRGFTIANTAAATGSWYGSLYGAITCTLSNVFLRDQGANVTAAGIVPSKFGLIVDITSGGSFTVTNCSFYPSSQTNVGGIYAENTTLRKSTNYTISSCLFVLRSLSGSYSIVPNGANDSTHTVTDCVSLCIGNSTGSTLYTRISNSANIVVNNLRSHGFYYALTRNEALAGNIGEITVDNIFHFGWGFVSIANAYINNGTFVMSNTVINNSIAYNGLNAAANAALVTSGYIHSKVFFNSCKFLGYPRLMYGTDTVNMGINFNQCHYEEAVLASSCSILIGNNNNINVSLTSCYLYTTFANQSFVTTQFTSLPIYSNRGRISYRLCSFNGDGSTFIPLINSKFLQNYVVTLDNCTFRDGSSNVTRQYVKMGAVYLSTDTYSGTGNSMELIPNSQNQSTFPFSYQFILPVSKTGTLTVNFKTKSYSLGGTVKARIENSFGVLSESTLTVSSSWDSQSISTTITDAFYESLYLEIELTGTTGYLVIDEITTSTTDNQLLTVDGSSVFLPEGGVAAAEVSNLFC